MHYLLILGADALLALCFVFQKNASFFQGVLGPRKVCFAFRRTTTGAFERVQAASRAHGLG